jgi:ATP-binding cassette subfamily C protein CydCD
VGVLGALAVAAVKLVAPFDYLLILLAIAAPLAGLLHWLESWLAHDIAYRLLAEMRIDLFRKLDTLAPAYLVRRRSGDLIALANQDIETIEYFFAHTVAPALVAVMVPAAVVLSLAFVSWPIALALLPFVLYAGLAPVVTRTRIDHLGAQARDALGLLSAYVTETIQGLSDLVAFQAVAGRRRGFMDLVRGYQQIRLELLRDLSSQTARLEIATGLGGLAVAVVGARLAAEHQLMATTLPLLILLALASFLPISEIAQVGRQLADTIASTRRYYAVQREQPAVADGPLRPPAPVGGSAIRFERVGFTYPGARRPALSDVELVVAAGATMALVGPSGAGKTSLVGLIARLYDPSEGTVLVDGADVRAVDVGSLRSEIAFVADDSFLFTASVAENIAYARPEASIEEIEAAAGRAQADEFIRALPDGYETRVGERGLTLSGGQRQRIAIARALLADPRILILDDATSSVDARTEGAIKTGLELAMAGRTTFVIAHRLSTVSLADEVVVIDGGRIVDRGTHEELMAGCGFYREIAEHGLADSVFLQRDLEQREEMARL